LLGTVLRAYPVRQMPLDSDGPEVLRRAIFGGSSTGVVMRRLPSQQLGGRTVVPTVEDATKGILRVDLGVDAGVSRGSFIETVRDQVNAELIDALGQSLPRMSGPHEDDFGVEGSRGLYSTRSFRFRL